MPELRQEIGKPLSILIVDSYDEDRYEVAEELAQLSPHYILHRAASGRTALEFLASHFVDCVLLELDLKDMSGFEVYTPLYRPRQSLA